jgi:hypothetical protein
VPAEYARAVTVLAVPEMFESGVTAIGIDFVRGDHVVLRPDHLEETVTVRVPLRDVVLREVQDSHYRYVQTVMRGSEQIRTEKEDTVDLLVPDLGGGAPEG